MNITQEGNDIEKEESLAELEARLILLNQTIDKLSAKRTLVVSKILKARAQKNEKSKR